MDAFLGQRPISLKALTDFSQLDQQSKLHLRNVYSCLAVSTLAAGLGAFIHIFANFATGSFLALIGTIGFMIALALTENHPKNQMKRIGYLVGFAFCTGFSLGPLIGQVIEVDPTIVSTAFFSTCVIFICFSLSALWAKERSFLYLGGSLMSCMGLMFMLGLMNIFFQSQMIYQIQLYGGLLLFCAFILYDTQLIVAKRKMGDTDFIWHSVDLFLDFVNIFRRIMVILANKEESKKKNRK